MKMRICFNPMKAVLIVLVFLLLYYPPILPVNIMHLLGAFSIFYSLTQCRNRFSAIISRFSFPLIVFTIYIVTVSLIRGNGITGAVSLGMLSIETVPTCLMISDLKVKKAKEVDFFDIIISAAILQSFVAFAAFMIPSLQKAIINQYISYGFLDGLMTMSNHRIYGFSYGLTYGMPLVNSCIATIAFYKGSRGKRMYYIKALVIFASAVINARLALVIFFIGVLGVLLSSVRDCVKTFKIIVYCVIAVVVLTQALNYVGKVSPETAEWIQHGIDDVTAFISGRDNIDYSYFSYATSRSKYTIPSDILTALFGTGRMAMGSGQSYATDIGFINDIWLGGFFYLIGIMTYFFGVIKGIFKYLEKKKAVPRSMVFVAIAIVLAANIKGVCLTLNELVQLILLCAVYFRIEEFQNQRVQYCGICADTKARNGQCTI